MLYLAKSKIVSQEKDSNIMQNNNDKQNDDSEPKLFGDSFAGAKLDAKQCTEKNNAQEHTSKDFATGRNHCNGSSIVPENLDDNLKLCQADQNKHPTVQYNKITKEFTLTTENMFMGSFTATDIIKHITKNNGENKNAMNMLIDKYVVSTEKDDNGYTKIILKKEIPPIMNNYKIMLVLSRSIIDVANELNITDPIARNNLKIVNRFIIYILEYTVRLISIIIDTQMLSTDDKHKLFLHAIILHGYCNEYICEEINKHAKLLNTRNEILSNINDIQNTLDGKQKKIEKTIHEQNLLLETAIDKYNSCVNGHVKHKTPTNIDAKVDNSQDDIHNSIKTLTDKIKEIADDNNDTYTHKSKSNTAENYFISEQQNIQDVKNSHDLDNNFDDKYDDSSIQENIQLIESSVK